MLNRCIVLPGQGVLGTEVTSEEAGPHQGWPHVLPGRLGLLAQVSEPIAARPAGLRPSPAKRNPDSGSDFLGDLAQPAAELRLRPRGLRVQTAGPGGFRGAPWEEGQFPTSVNQPEKPTSVLKNTS